MVFFSVAPQMHENENHDMFVSQVLPGPSNMGVSYIKADFDLKPGGKEILFEHTANIHLQNTKGDSTEDFMAKNVQIKTDDMKVYLQAGGFRIPLIQDETAILRFTDGLYVLNKPVINGDEKDILIDFRPFKIDNEELLTFECLLRYYAVLEVRSGENYLYLSGEEKTTGIQSPAPVTPQQRKKARKCDYVVRGGVIAAEYVSWAGDQATVYMKGYSDKKRVAVQNAQGNGDVDPKTIKKLQRVSTVADTALKGANFITGTIGKVAGTAAGVVASQGGKYAVNKKGEETYIGAAMRATGAGMIAWNTVWEASETAGMTFLAEGEKETADYYYKVYGPNGAQAATLACRSTAKSAKAGYKIGTLGPKTIIKASAKEAGKAVTKAGYEQNPHTEGALPEKKRWADTRKQGGVNLGKEDPAISLTM